MGSAAATRRQHGICEEEPGVRNRGARLLAFCQGGAGWAMRAAQGEGGTHVAGMQPAHSRTIVAEMRVYAIGIQQTMGQQLEHGDLAVW